MSRLDRLTGCVLGVALVVALVAGAIAAPAETPRAFVEAIYKTYLGRDSKGIALTDEAAIRRYFAPPLSNALVKDRAEADRRGDAPTLDGDPFIDGQDWQISRLAIDVKPAGADAATATVTFTNFKAPATIHIDLVRTAAGWRIAEIKSATWSLKDLMKVK